MDLFLDLCSIYLLVLIENGRSIFFFFFTSFEGNSKLATMKLKFGRKGVVAEVVKCVVR